MYEDLINLIEQDEIYYINNELALTKGIIAKYKDIVALIVDDDKIETKADENTVLLHELGHYLAGSYYRTNSPYEVISKVEYKADKSAWEKFIPYNKVIELMKQGRRTVTELADYFDIDAPYIARCINYYNNQYGFNNI